MKDNTRPASGVELHPVGAGKFPKYFNQGSDMDSLCFGKIVPPAIGGGGVGRQRPRRQGAGRQLGICRNRKDK